MDVHGAMVSEVQLAAGVTSMAWSAEKFKMEEGDDEALNGSSTTNQSQGKKSSNILFFSETRMLVSTLFLFSVSGLVTLNFAKKISRSYWKLLVEF